MILPEAPPAIAQGVARRIQELVGAKKIPPASSEVSDKVTVSIGIASCQPHDSARSILERADQALYQAKTEGRNRVCLNDYASPEQSLSQG